MTSCATDARPLLYLKSSANEDALSSVVRAQGWDIHVATHAGEALDVLEERDIFVGMVGVDSADHDVLLRQLHDLHETGRRVHWVALLSDRDLLLQPPSRRLINYFYDYHTLPLDAERLNITLGHAHGMAAIANSAVHARRDCFTQHRMVGKSPRMRDLFRKIHRVAGLDLTVMIRGESGTGKELAAEAIHRTSHRANGPFIAVNCGALPRDLIQTELFGHEKGSFTGADRRRLGRIEAASGGTLFLDEIGDLPFDLQVNLLRFLQERTVDRIGASHAVPVDVRVIAATNVDLEQAVASGRFREDLYYRLNVLHLEMPPLRERPEDIEVLAEYFFEEASRQIPSGPKGFSQSALQAIKSYGWPGNVRELLNRVQRAVVMCEENLIKPRDLGLDGSVTDRSLLTLSQVRLIAERDAITTALKATRNNVSRSAKSLGVSRVTLYRLMEAHGIDWQ